MHITPLHRWDVTPAEAVQLQRELAQRLDLCTPLARLELVAGADISYNKYDPTMYATVIVYRVADGEIVEVQDAVVTTTFPYVPGLLTFREAPSYLQAFAKLQTVPDAVMFDGQGVAHPRRMGLAAHLGLWLGLPSLGCAKSRLFGRYQEPGPAAGALAPLTDGDEQIGYVVRTKNRCNPVFVSAGHLIDQASAVRVVLATGRGYRIPEPTPEPICASTSCAGTRLVEGRENLYDSSSELLGSLRRIPRRRHPNHAASTRAIRPHAPQRLEDARWPEPSSKRSASLTISTTCSAMPSSSPRMRRCKTLFATPMRTRPKLRWRFTYFRSTTAWKSACSMKASRLTWPPCHTSSPVNCALAGAAYS